MTYSFNLGALIRYLEALHTWISNHSKLLVTVGCNFYMAVNKFLWQKWFETVTVSNLGKFWLTIDHIFVVIFNGMSGNNHILHCVGKKVNPTQCTTEMWNLNASCVNLVCFIATVDRFYWNSVVCLQLYVTLLMQNFVKIRRCLAELWKHV